MNKAELLKLQKKVNKAMVAIADVNSDVQKLVAGLEFKKGKKTLYYREVAVIVSRKYGEPLSKSGIFRNIELAKNEKMPIEMALAWASNLIAYWLR